jgi:hypothetical protein
MAPAESTFFSALPVLSATQMLAPSKTRPYGLVNPAVTVVAVHGTVGPGVRIVIAPPWFAVQTREPSNAIPKIDPTRLLATVVTPPAGWDGSIE